MHKYYLYIGTSSSNSTFEQTEPFPTSISRDITPQTLRQTPCSIPKLDHSNIESVDLTGDVDGDVEQVPSQSSKEVPGAS